MIEILGRKTSLVIGLYNLKILAFVHACFYISEIFQYGFFVCYF